MLWLSRTVNKKKSYTMEYTKVCFLMFWWKYYFFKKILYRFNIADADKCTYKKWFTKIMQKMHQKPRVLFCILHCIVKKNSNIWKNFILDTVCIDAIRNVIFKVFYEEMCLHLKMFQRNFKVFEDLSIHFTKTTRYQCSWEYV